jgi:hypothetical protein
MECANTKAMEKYHSKLELQEVCLNSLINRCDDEMVELQAQIEVLLKIASDFDGYDFSEDMKDMIKDMI